MGLLDNKSSGGGDKDGHEGMAERMVTGLSKLIQIALPMKFSNIGEVGVFSGLEPNKAFDLNKPIVAAGSGLSMKGGGLAAALSSIMKRPDFAGIAAYMQASADIGPAQNVSMADLGTFSPPVFEGLRGGGIEMGGGGMSMNT